MKGRLVRAASAAVLAGGVMWTVAELWVRATPMPPLVPETSVIVTDRDGTLLRAYTVADGRWRLPVQTGQVDPQFISQLMAFEDRRFMRHHGVDTLSVLRALWQAARNGRIVSGGSTLTMQVARLLEGGSTGQLRAKLRQTRLALALERRLSKVEILHLYLLLAPYGGNIEGVRAASLSYFGKEPKRLTPAESALLVALPQAPESRRPDRFSVQARVARNRVLDRAVAGGSLARDEAEAAKSEPVPTTRNGFPALAPHLSDRLRAETPTLGVIHTSLSRDLQASLESLLLSAAREGPDTLSAAIIVADYTNGEVLAQAGSADFLDTRRRGFVDMTRALRSPGSTLKPLIYGLAFEDGIALPETLVEDRPTAFNGYAPQNFDKRFRGTLTVREALQMSLNIPAVALLDAVGPAKLLARMRRAGAEPVLPPGRMPGLAIGLGGVGMTLEDLVRLYGAIARGGVAMDLHATGNGMDTSLRQRVLDAKSAWRVGNILLGTPPPLYGPEGKIAYKTGTSYGYRDAWAVGFDGRHVIGVWLGRADGTPLPGALGVDVAAPVLFEAFSRLKTEPEPLPAAPKGLQQLANRDLPLPLRQFVNGDPLVNPDRPEIAFPPDGARIQPANGPLAIKLRRGQPPFTLLVNGEPVPVFPWDTELSWQPEGRGYVTISIIDALGASAQSHIWIE